MDDLIEIIEDGDICTIFLNRVEKRNALNRAMLAEIDAAIDECQSRVLIFEGRGDHFCSGLDLHQAREEGVADLVGDLFEKIYHLPILTIASVHGSVMAAGIGITAACDVAIAEEGCRFAFPEVRRGLIPALVFHLMCGQVPSRKLQELFFSGREFSVDEAQMLGLVHHQVASNRREFTLEYAKKLLLGAPNALIKTKLMMRKQYPFLKQEALAMHISARDSEEAQEGITAFEEKRLPHWKRS